MVVSIVLPCYDPPAGWEQTICSNYASFSKRINNDPELILVLDGMRDTTEINISLALLQEQIPLLQVVRYTENRGKGYALRQGVAKASGDIIIYTDVDFPYSPDSILSIYEALKNDTADVAVGVKNDTYYAQVPFVRRLISKCLRSVIRLFLSMPITDTQCGLKGFKQPVAPLFLQTVIDRYLFDLEFVRNCFKSKKYRVKAIQVALNDNVHFRSMNYRILLPEMLNFARLLFQ